MTEKKDEKADKAEKPAKAGVDVMALALTAVFAGAAAFGGAKVAGARGAAPASGHGHEPAAPPHVEAPGITMALEPFLVMSADANHHTHPMRVVIAVELEQNVREEMNRPFIPRIRDSVLTYLRSLTYETASDPAHMDHLRTELMERLRGTGAVGISRVLVTDLVVQ